MNKEDLSNRILLGEDATFEFKQVYFTNSRIRGPKRAALADELAAMANGLGGILLLGVDDKSREVLGIPLERLDSVDLWVQEICNDTIKPALSAYIHKVTLDTSDGTSVPLIAVEIERSLFVHKSPGGYFRRTSSSKREMSPEVLARLFQERSQSRVIRFDESTVPGTSVKDFDESLTRRFARGKAANDVATLNKLGVVRDDEQGIARLTLAGVLMCTVNPQRWMPHAEIQAVSYAGERVDVDYQMDAKDIGGPLDRQVHAALHFVRRNMFVAARKALGRAELPQFSERAVFESLVNAVAHRDYAMAGARVRMHLFYDRLEFYVPGSLANTLTPESMDSRQYSRNELIVSLLARCKVDDAFDVARSNMMDRRGDGVPIILEASRELSGRTPEYSLLNDNELRLVIWASHTP